MNKRSLILLPLLLAAAVVTPLYAAPTYACYASLSATPPCVGQSGCDTTTYFQVNAYSTAVASIGTNLDISDFALSKPVDQNSVTLFSDMLLGTKIPAITMVCLQTDHHQSFTFLEIQLLNVLIVSDQVGDTSSRKTESTEGVAMLPEIVNVKVYTPATATSPASSSGYSYNTVTKTATSND
jgi:type VI protein secretion system component Hcp